MKYVITIMLTMVISSFAFADHHALTLEARQARTELTITSLDLGDEVSVITAEADMGEYGKTYVSYHLTYNRDGSGGNYTVQGRGYVDEDTIFSGSGAGTWVRDGHLVVMTGIVNVSDGSQNLDKIIVNPLERTLTLDVYALDQTGHNANLVARSEFNSLLGFAELEFDDTKFLAGQGYASGQHNLGVIYEIGGFLDLGS